MKILQVNKFHYLRGGAEKYYLTVSKALEKKGHDVAYFSMQHSKNIASDYSKYFVSELDFDHLSFKDLFTLPGRMIYSLQAKRKFTELMENFKPEIVHLHNIYHHLSPSILPVAKKSGAKVVMHLHDYKLICPNYQLYNQGKTLWNCCGGRFYNCVKIKCFKNSYLQSALVSLEYFVHHYLLKIYDKNVDLYIAPSQFMKDACVRFGVPASKIKVLYNFIDDEELVKKITVGDYFLYFGRLSSEKGINDLVDAYTKVDIRQKLKIVGEGPEKTKLEDMVKTANLEGKIEFIGFLQGSDLKQAIDGSQAVITPSVWPENMPFALIEALGHGKPVIASRVGGLPELIHSKENGLLFRAGDTDDLALKLREFSKLDNQQLSKQSLQTASGLLLSKHLDRLLRAYKSLK